MPAHRTRRVLVGVAVAVGALVWGAHPPAASAHPLLLQAAPPPGLVAPRSPQAINLALSEAAVKRGSTMVVTDPHGHRVATGPLTAANGGRTLSITPRARLRSAVYKVTWTALGDDGHLVGGNFSFGVAGPHGAPPPGAEHLGGSSLTGRGGENAGAESAVSIVARWLGIAAAALLAGGSLLLELLRRRRVAGRALEVQRTAAPLAWMLALLAASEGVIAGATVGARGGFDMGLLTAGATGVAELVRAIVAVLFTVALAFAGEDRRRARDVVYASGGAALLLGYGLSGHVLSDPSAFALVVQAVHVVAAGLWLGGVLALVMFATRGGVKLLDGARSFAPIAATTIGAAVVTGVLAALHEVDKWYFLRFTGYGRVVLIKSAVVLVVMAAGGYATWRVRRGAGPHRGLLRAELAGAAVVLALAATLSGITQGRGQPLPATRGTLFPGPAFATAITAGGNQAVGLAPARSGSNTVTVTPPPGVKAPTSVRARFACACSERDIHATLRRGRGATWSSAIDLPDDGAWFAYLDVDGKAAPSPVQLGVGVPHAAGSKPVNVLEVADLSGPDASACRASAIGLELAAGRQNAANGVDGGRKIVPIAYDDGGDPTRAAAVARQAIEQHGAAALVPCGGGGAGAIKVASGAGVPSVVADPAVDPTTQPDSFRLAADPYAQGRAFAQMVRGRIGPQGVAGVKTVRVDVADDLQGRRLAQGLREALGASGYKLVTLAPGALARQSPRELADLLDRRRTTALILDGPAAGGADAAALAAVGSTNPQVPPAPALLSERVLSERLVQQAGPLGRLGVLQGVSEVSPTTNDGLLYRTAVPLLYPGELPSLSGMRGYAAGLGLMDALRHGTEHAAIEAKLTKPDVFTDALLAPWSPRRPGAGSPSVLPLQPQFLAPTLVPTAAGGEANDPGFFPDGTWTVTDQKPYGLTPATPAPPVTAASR